MYPTNPVTTGCKLDHHTYGLEKLLERVPHITGLHFHHDPMTAEPLVRAYGLVNNERTCIAVANEVGEIEYRVDPSKIDPYTTIYVSA